MSDWDRLNDFLRFVLDGGEDRQHAQTAHKKLMHVNQHSKHSNHTKSNDVHTAV